jgi:hypothetical protein
MIFRFKPLAAIFLLAIASAQAGAANVTDDSRDFTISTNANDIGQPGASLLDSVKNFSAQGDRGENRTGSAGGTFEQSSGVGQDSQASHETSRVTDDQPVERGHTFSHREGIEHHFVPSPVPEPESLAMLLAGLGMIGVVVGRRRK